jgi:hypothetical protein
MDKKEAMKITIEKKLIYIVSDKWKNYFPVVSINFETKEIKGYYDGSNVEIIPFKNLIYVFSIKDMCLVADSALHKIIRKN